MDTQQDRLVLKIIAKMEFWKGIMAGTMAGMAIAAFAYEILDRRPREWTTRSQPQLSAQESDRLAA
jgi:hypothetical protein